MGQTILLVDDHEKLRESFRDWLGVMLPGCSFLEARSGEEAVSLASAQQPDIVLMDVRMGTMNGIEATKQIKSASPDTQVVMLTIYDAESYRKDASQAGASAYILKQRAHSELVPLLEGLLGKAGEALPESA